MGRKPSLWHLHVWGCPVEVRIYNPHEKKLDSRTISVFLLVIQNNLKGTYFIVLTIARELLKLEMLGSLKMVKLVGVWNHIKWKFKKLECKFLCLDEYLKYSFYPYVLHIFLVFFYVK